MSNIFLLYIFLFTCWIGINLSKNNAMRIVGASFIIVILYLATMMHRNYYILVPKRKMAVYLNTLQKQIEQGKSKEVSDSIKAYIKEYTATEKVGKSVNKAYTKLSINE